MEKKVISFVDNFNYQVVYKISDKERVVFVGQTSKSVDDVLNSCEECLDLSIVPVIESVNYSPINLENNVEKK